MRWVQNQRWRSVVRGGGSQVRGGGAEIPRDPPSQFNHCPSLIYAEIIYLFWVIRGLELRHEVEEMIGWRRIQVLYQSQQQLTDLLPTVLQLNTHCTYTTHSSNNNNNNNNKNKTLYPNYHACLAARHVGKFHEVTPSNPKVTGTHMLNFKPIYECSLLKIVWADSAEIWSCKKVDLGGSKLTSATFFVSRPKFTRPFWPTAGGIAVDTLVFRLWIYLSLPKIFSILFWSCPKSALIFVTTMKMFSCLYPSATIWMVETIPIVNQHCKSSVYKILCAGYNAV